MLEADLAAVVQHVFGNAPSADELPVAAGAYGIDDTGPFVARYLTEPGAIPACDHHKIGRTYPTGGDSDAHVTGRRFGYRARLHFELAGGGVDYRRVSRRVSRRVALRAYR